MTYDDLLESVATSVPAFGGLYFREGRQLVLVLTDLGQASAALTAVNAVFDLEAVNPEGDAVAVQGDYGFGELRTWYRTLQVVWELEGVVQTDIDEFRNRIVIEYLSPATEDDVWQVIAGTEVPTSAVIVEVGEPTEELSSSRSAPSHLDDRFDAMEGGIQVDADDETPCTLGFNATSTLVNVSGFVTNSHCTDQQWSTSGSSIFFQPLDNVSSHRIGIELIDPPAESQQTNPDCPPGDLCRYSDSAFIEYDDGVPYLLGVIARPELLNVSKDTSNAVLELGDPAEYRRQFDIIGEDHLYKGLEVHKVGQTTGHTKGGVDRACVNRLGGVGVRLICQANISGMYAEGGDSGSPVLIYVPSQTGLDSQKVHLVGLLWGSTSSIVVVSPINNVEKDLAGAPFGDLITY